MKRWYFLVALVFAVGFGLVMYTTVNPAAVTLFGVTIQAHVINGLGLITMILGVLAFLAVYGNSLPPNRAERRVRVLPQDEDLSARDNRPSRRLSTARTVSRRSASTPRPVPPVTPTKEDAGSLQ